MALTAVRLPTIPIQDEIRTPFVPPQQYAVIEGVGLTGH